jgi:transaldolase
MPEPTLNSVRDFGHFKGNTISGTYEESRRTLEKLLNLGIDISEVADKLEREGIDKFIKPWLELIAAVDKASR